MTAVRSDHQVTFHKPVEFRFEVDDACHLVVEEEVGDERSRLPSRLGFGHDDVEDLIRDGSIEPGPNYIIIVSPFWGVVDRDGAGVDVGEEIILVEKDTDQHVPLGEVGVLEVEGD